MHSTINSIKIVFVEPKIRAVDCLKERVTNDAVECTHTGIAHALKKHFGYLKDHKSNNCNKTSEFQCLFSSTFGTQTPRLSLSPSLPRFHFIPFSSSSCVFQFKFSTKIPCKTNDRFCLCLSSLLKIIVKACNYPNRNGRTRINNKKKWNIQKYYVPIAFVRRRSHAVRCSQLTIQWKLGRKN